VNQFLDARYMESAVRLVLGIEPRDAKRRMRLAQPIDIVVEGPALTARAMRALLEEGRVLSDTMRRLPRHASCRHVLVYDRPPKDGITLRLLDRWQRFVPRRLQVPLVHMVHADRPAELDFIPPGQRTRRPQLFPGAAYDVGEQSTGLRGRAVRRDLIDATILHPARWARVEARRNDEVVGTAHADHRGEFLLLLDAEAVREGQLVFPLTVSVTARAPRIAPVPTTVLAATVDPLWDLPLEILADPGVLPDGAADGIVDPGGYDGSATQAVEFQYGVLRSLGVAPFEIT
jgi:hypothetical protein